MTESLQARRHSAQRPALTWFAVVGSVWVFVLITLGAFTTSIGAGMVFPDWPLSNGSMNPHGWLGNVAMFAEHSHRLSGSVMGIITLALALWLWRVEPRRWLRNLGWAALACVIVQGLIGGNRVLLDSLAVPGFEMTLGRMLRIPHGIVAHLFGCLLFAIAVSLSRHWRTTPAPVSRSLRKAGIVSCLLMVAQLTIAATMRHHYAGLAIPTFPFSTPGGNWLPPAWSFPVAIHFAHRITAAVLAAAVGWFAVKLWRDPGATPWLRRGALALAGLFGLQILLGVCVIWQGREPHVTTVHVALGALLLAVTFTLTWLAHRDSIEGRSADSPEPGAG